MDITSTKCRFRSSEAAQTQHTCHNGPVSGRELWQVCLACARYQTSFSLSLLLSTPQSPHHRPPDFSILYHRARKTQLPQPALTGRNPHSDQDKPPARLARRSCWPVRPIVAKGLANQSRAPFPQLRKRITRGGHAA